MAVLSRLRLTLALWLLALGLLAGPAALAGEPAPTVMIVDSSGSMAAREPGGAVKLDAARGVVADVLARWPAGGRLALMAYGHRRQGDCSDVETILGLGPVEPERVRMSLASLRARGKTPLSLSLQLAVKQLPPGGGTIVLVSDGLETCEADPCAVAADLKRANARLVIHVVGFGIAREETDALACIATAGGGRFFDARTAPDLAAALGSVTETIAEAAPPSPPPPSPAPPPTPPPAPAAPAPAPAPPSSTPAPLPKPPEPLPGPVAVGLEAIAGTLGPVVDAPVRWTITDPSGREVFAGEGRGVSLELAPGRYDVSARAANAAGRARIEIGPQAGQRFPVEVLAGRLDLSLAADPRSPPFDDVEAAGVAWRLDPRDGQGSVAVPALARPSLLLAPGRYRAQARLKGLTAEADIVVSPGAPVSAALDLQLGTLALEAVLAGSDAPIEDAGLLRWRVGEGEAATRVEGQARPRLTLPAGRYPVVLTIAGAEVPAEAEIVAGEERTLRVSVEGGEVELAARLAPDSPPLEDWRDASWTLTPLSGPAMAGGAIDAQATATLPLSPGRWEVVLTSGAATVRREFDVAPGSHQDLPIVLDAGRLTAQAVPASGPPAANTVYDFIRLGDDGIPADQATASTGSSSSASSILQAGRWRIAASDSEGRSGTLDLRLEAGEERSVEIPVR